MPPSLPVRSHSASHQGSAALQPGGNPAADAGGLAAVLAGPPVGAGCLVPATYEADLHCNTVPIASEDAGGGFRSAE